MFSKLFATALAFIVASLISSRLCLAQSTPAYITFKVGGWHFAPIVSQAAQTATGFLAHYEGTDATGGNLRLLLFEKDSNGDWNRKVWTSGSLGSAGLYVVETLSSGNTVLGDPLIADAVQQIQLTCNDVYVVPEPIEIGLAKTDAMYEVVKGLSDPGPTLDNLKQVGYAVTPELPAITALITAKVSGDRRAIQRAMTLATGSAEPQSEPTSVSLEAASLDADAKGMQILLNTLASEVEIRLFNASIASWIWPFCGCSTSYGQCVTAGAEYFCGSAPSTGHQLNCKYCTNGTQSYAYTGQTFWTCSTCTGGGSVACHLITSTCQTYCDACPATSAGCN